MILTVIFFIIVGFYLMGLLGRLLLTYWVRKKQREFAQGGGFAGTYTWGTGRTRASRPKPEGDISVQRTRDSREKQVSKTVGDYVEYEEVEEIEIHEHEKPV